jgi:imidazolonepropionase-like amidohydrolase
VGTDTPNPFVLPGASVHEELRLFVEAGLTPYAALAAATREPARFLDRLHETGTIEPGKRANLVLLHASPVEDIRNTARIAGVIVRGRYLEPRRTP